MGSCVLRSPVAAPLKASAKWITGGPAEKYTQVIAMGGLSSGPPALLKPWQEIRGVSEQKNHLRPSLLSLLFCFPFHLLCSAPLISSPLLTFILVRFLQHPLHFLLFIHRLPSFTVPALFFCLLCVCPLYPPPSASTPSGRGINKC